MIEQHTDPDHYIQRYILDVLRHSEFARFRDLRPSGVDSNAFSYHLTRLMKEGYLHKLEQGYTLTTQGLSYIDRVSKLDTRPRRQPKIMTLTFIFNELEEILVRHKETQPMINRVTCACGMMHMDDPTIKDAALREIREKMGIELDEIHHVGDCYMAIRSSGIVIMNTLMHVFVAHVRKSDIIPNDTIFWRSRTDLADAAPATRLVLEVLQRTLPGAKFFEEFVEDM
jgi:8-oxo-dGTP pyrophosphatase MutT (NUDIX family)